MIRWRWVLPGLVVVEVVMVALAFGWVAIHSYLISPGQPVEAYEAYAKVASPIVSVIAGVPVFWGLGALLRRRLGADAWRSAYVLVALYVALDLVLVMAFADDCVPAGLIGLLSWVTKALAVRYGVRRGG